MKKYRLRENSLAYKVAKVWTALDKIDESPFAKLVACVVIGLAFGALVGYGMNEIHPLF